MATTACSELMLDSHFLAFRPDFTSKLEHGLALGTLKFYISLNDKINHGIVNMSSNCDVKSGLRMSFKMNFESMLEV